MWMIHVYCMEQTNTAYAIRYKKPKLTVDEYE